MKRFQIGLALVAAVITLSFTVASRSLDVDPYAALANCYESFSSAQDANVNWNETNFTFDPIVPGCQTSISTQGAKRVSPSTLLSAFTNVTGTGRKLLYCLEELNVICCFRIDNVNKKVLDVCTGTPNAYQQ